MKTNKTLFKVKKRLYWICFETNFYVLFYKKNKKVAYFLYFIEKQYYNKKLINFKNL